MMPWQVEQHDAMAAWGSTMPWQGRAACCHGKSLAFPCAYVHGQHRLPGFSDNDQALMPPAAGTPLHHRAASHTSNRCTHQAQPPRPGHLGGALRRQAGRQQHIRQGTALAVFCSSNSGISQRNPAVQLASEGTAFGTAMPAATAPATHAAGLPASCSLNEQQPC